MCDNEISEEECFFALSNNMKLNKTFGRDGILIELYKRFWPYIKKTLMDSYKYGFKFKELAYSHREAIITLMFKRTIDHY